MSYLYCYRISSSTKVKFQTYVFIERLKWDLESLLFYLIKFKFSQVFVKILAIHKISPLIKWDKRLEKYHDYFSQKKIEVKMGVKDICS